MTFENIVQGDDVSEDEEKEDDWGVGREGGGTGGPCHPPSHPPTPPFMILLLHVATVS